MSLLLVMVAVSASLVITLSFIRTQTSCLRIRKNSLRRDLALQAAQTGASVGLEAMNSTSWGGVTVPLTRTVLSDTEGTSSYYAEFLPIQDVTATIPADAPLYVAIRSTGTWVSAGDATEQVSRQVEVITKLLPRVAGRTINAGDSASASDVTANPGSYDTIQSYAAAVKVGSIPFKLEPGDRVDGNIWLYADPQFYSDPLWSATIRDTLLDSIGSQYGTTTGGATIIHPHPINGQITFRVTPAAAVQTDLTRLGVSWNQNATIPTWPVVSYTNLLTYKLFQGGFTYTADTVGASLSSVTLKPTTSNPLGIFYHDGDMSLLNGCNIYGTLVCTGKVTLNGSWIHIASLNWRDSTGALSTWNGNLWPRLPAIISKHVYVEDVSRATVTGALATQLWFQTETGSYDQSAVADVSITGTATCQPIQQPLTLVQLAGAPDLSSIDASGNYSIWLKNGVTGSWHEILDVNNGLHQLKVVGEVQYSSPTDFVIRRNRLRYYDFQGPILAEKILGKLPVGWLIPTATNWDTINTAWTTLNTTRAASMLPPISFVDYLADPANWSTWVTPLKTYGLPLEPTFHLRNTTGIKYQWTAPLFTPYNGTGGNAPYAGYRWKIISWRQVS